jgi:hypothetical protein
MARWRTGPLVLGGMAAVGGCEISGPGEEVGEIRQALTQSKSDDKAHPQVVGLRVPLNTQVGVHGVAGQRPRLSHGGALRPHAERAGRAALRRSRGLQRSAR